MSSASRSAPPPFAFLGALLLCLGFGIYLLGIAFSIVRLALALSQPWTEWNARLIWYSGVPSTLGIGLVALDFGLFLPEMV